MEAYVRFVECHGMPGAFATVGLDRLICSFDPFMPQGCKCVWACTRGDDAQGYVFFSTTRLIQNTESISPEGNGQLAWPFFLAGGLLFCSC